MTFELEVGHTVAGRYELSRLLGRGAMGEVWLARHQTLGEDVAIKFLRPEAEPTETAATALARFLFEAQVAARLSRKSRHIVRVTDHGDDAGAPYLVMERLEGESLEDRLLRGSIPIPTLQNIIAQCARGLSVAHAEGVFHRDLKPANMFLCKDDDGKLLVKLLDFGIARAIRKEVKRSPTSTARGMVLGTPSYMSPEQARGLAHLDHRSDVWSLAVIAYEALTGSIPFPGETAEDVFLSVCTHTITPIRDMRPGLGDDVARFFDRAFSAHIEERFPTAEALADAFAALSLDDDVPPPRSNAQPHDGGATQAKLAVTLSALPLTRGRLAGVAGALAVVLVIVGFGLKLALAPAARDARPSAPPASVEVPVAPVRAAPATPDPPSVPTLAWSQLPVADPAVKPPPLPPTPLRPAATAAKGILPLPTPPPDPPPAVAPPPPPPPPPPAPKPSAGKKPVDKSDVF